MKLNFVKTGLKFEFGVNPQSFSHELCLYITRFDIRLRLTKFLVSIIRKRTNNNSSLEDELDSQRAHDEVANLAQLNIEWKALVLRCMNPVLFALFVAQGSTFSRIAKLLVARASRKEASTGAYLQNR